MAEAIVCAGRPVNDHGQPVGDPCGSRFAMGIWSGGYVPNTDGTEMVWQPPRVPTDEEARNSARAAGWSIAGPPMCPKCRKPDPAIVRDLTTKEQL